MNLYLKPLIDELKQLCEPTVDMYDQSISQTFKMRAALLWTMIDFLRLALLFIYSTKVKLTCPYCHYGTCSMSLKLGQK